MAIKLVTEVMDWAPPLTHREHKVLMVLAENARLPSRETWDSVESPRILRWARLTRTQMYAVIAALVDKGCLVKPVWGGKNHRAKYKIAHLAIPRTAEAQYAAFLAKLSPAERQAMVYAERLEPDHDQCPGFADTDHGSQRPGIQDTDHSGQDHDQRPRKPGPRLPSSTGRRLAGLEGADDPSIAAAGLAEQERRRAEHGGQRQDQTHPSPFPNPGNGNGPDNGGSDDQQPPIEVHLQSPAADRYAREDDETEFARQAAANALTDWMRADPEAAQP